MRESVKCAYSEAAVDPSARHAFPVGRDFALSVGYPEVELDRLPASCSEAFAGVSNVAVVADIGGCSQALDLGCGSGLDSLILARRLGASGSVIGLDFSPSMLERAQAAAAESATKNVEFRLGSAEEIPLPAESVDLILVNGIFNLNPFREEIFGEMARVLRAGGRAFAAELILKEPLPPEMAAGSTNWFA